MRGLSIVNLSHTPPRKLFMLTIRTTNSKHKNQVVFIHLSETKPWPLENAVRLDCQSERVILGIDIVDATEDKVQTFFIIERLKIRTSISSSIFRILFRFRNTIYK